MSYIQDYIGALSLLVTCKSQFYQTESRTTWQSDGELGMMEEVKVVEPNEAERRRSVKFPIKDISGLSLGRQENEPKWEIM